MRGPDGGPGPSRRVAGAMFAARTGGLGRPGGAAVNQHVGQQDSVPRPARLRAIAIAALGVAATGVVIGGLWAWIAPPIRAVVAITRAGERVRSEERRVGKEGRSRWWQAR